MSRVHVDYTVKSGPSRLHAVLPEEAERLSRIPFAVIQVSHQANWDGLLTAWLLLLLYLPVDQWLLCTVQTGGSVNLLLDLIMVLVSTLIVLCKIYI